MVDLRYVVIIDIICLLNDHVKFVQSFVLILNVNVHSRFNTSWSVLL